MSSTVSGKIGKWIVLAVGMSASGTIWLREHWLDMIVGVAMWSIVVMLFGILGVEGTAELKESAFSSDGFSVSLQRTADGKVRAIVVPDGTPTSFFLRMKVK